MGKTVVHLFEVGCFLCFGAFASKQLLTYLMVRLAGTFHMVHDTTEKFAADVGQSTSVARSCFLERSLTDVA